MTESPKYCALIPVYRHGKTLRAVVAGVLSKGLPSVIVDDGNDGETKDCIARVKIEFPSAEIVTLEKNRGKGGAVMAGMLRALELGYTHALQVDADGQHSLDCVADFLDASSKNPDALIAGYPVFDESVPFSRKIGREITNFCILIETLSGDIADGMCGFRLYPLEQCRPIITRCMIGKRMNFDIEILVRLKWAGVRMAFMPIGVIYPEGGVSNFRMVRDNVGISLMHAKLLLAMIPRIPIILFRKAKHNGD